MPSLLRTRARGVLAGAAGTASLKARGEEPNRTPDQLASDVGFHLVCGVGVATAFAALDP